MFSKERADFQRNFAEFSFHGGVSVLGYVFKNLIQQIYMNLTRSSPESDSNFCLQHKAPLLFTFFPTAFGVTRFFPWIKYFMITMVSKYSNISLNLEKFWCSDQIRTQPRPPDPQPFYLYDKERYISYISFWIIYFLFLFTTKLNCSLSAISVVFLLRHTFLVEQVTFPWNIKFKLTLN